MMLRRFALLAAVSALGACGGGGGGGGDDGPGGGSGGLDPDSIESRTVNWAGYVKNGSPGSISKVGGSWIVPSVSCADGEESSSSTWAGVGGSAIDPIGVVSEPLLIQAGTTADCLGGAPDYAVWWEALPAPPLYLDPATYDVQPGDTMRVQIDGSSLLLWSISIQNVSNGWTYEMTVPYVTLGTSAEWIHEAPTIIVGGSGTGIAVLPNFGRVGFFGLTANDVSPSLTADDAVLMENADGAAIAVPSAPSNGDRFSVCYGGSACS